MTAHINSRTPPVAADSGKSVAGFTPTSPEDLPEIIGSAENALQEWSALSLADRKACLRRAYHEFHNAKDEVAELVSSETGKPLCEAYSSEILPVLDCFKYYLGNIQRFIRETTVTPINPLLRLRRGVVRYEPLGVVAVISPWNFPLLLSMQHIVPALLIGNVVIHKPSELTTLTGLKLREVFDRASLPKDVLQVVAGFADLGAALVSSAVDKIFFTGSSAVGRKVYQAAAQNLTPVNMELGGSDPMVILEDANLEKAANAALWGGFTNAGQACVSVERIYVHEKRHSEFLEKLLSKARRLRLDESGPDNDVGGMINEVQRDKVAAMVNQMEAGGAVLLLGGTESNERSKESLRPTIISGRDAETPLGDQEIFGPVFSVTPFATDDQAIERANASRYGLSASIWTEDKKRGLMLANGIEAATVHVNEVMSHLAQFEAPYAGYKESGLGVSRGPWGIQELVRTKYVTVDRPWLSWFLRTTLRHLGDNNVWWFHYGRERAADFRAFADFLHSKSLLSRIQSGFGALRALFRKDFL